MQSRNSLSLARNRWTAVALACLPALFATPAEATTWNYVFSGTIASTYTMAEAIATHSQFYNSAFKYVAVKNNVADFGGSPQDRYEAAAGSQGQ